MKKGFLKYLTAALPLLAILLLQANSPKTETAKYPEKLSEWQFFSGNLASLKPTEGVYPYEMRTPLFSDYAHKLRFIKIPKGKKAVYDAKEVFDFPVGTVLIKNFYYPIDARYPDKGRRILETRLLIHEESGWENLIYIWDEAQQEAFLDLAGDTKAVQWIDEKGKKQKLDYVIPNKNQCKGCHQFNEKVRPIGPTARQLNGHARFENNVWENQLQYWSKAGLLEALPTDSTQIPRIAIWNDPQSASVDARARAWLDINCAHCHRAEGPGSTSGLFLSIHEQNPTALGLHKTPVAAGRGSGGLKFDIEPGHPEKSILLYRMQSLDPGVMMPEIARKLVHKEGVELIKAWIKEMK